MNAFSPTSPFAHIELAPRDPILGITEGYNADQNPRRVNLGVGVYYDNAGRLPLLQSVRQAEQQLVEQNRPRGYLPIEGLAAYNAAVQPLLFGADSAAIKAGRIVTLQSLGGTGALKLGADFLKRFIPGAAVHVSNPSWENHRALFEGAGFEVNTYPYYGGPGKGVDFTGMLDRLSQLPAGDIVLLHACCHNPTGLDLTREQWAQVIELVRVKQLIPFLDIAYQGFGDGIDADAYAVRAFLETAGPLLVASSFSKSMALYGERVGALSLVGADADEAKRLLSQLKRVARVTYSNPPTHGGQVAALVLTQPELRTLWEKELGEMRDRIRTMRHALASQLAERVPGRDFSFITSQRGMFSYSGLSKEEVAKLKETYSIYAVDSGRICVAALNDNNVDYVAQAIAEVV